MYAVSKEKTQNELVAERHWREGDPFVSSVPHWIHAIGNTNCNIRCPFCFAWSEITRPRELHSDLSEQALETFAEFIRKGTRMLELYGGGEILLSPSFWRFLEIFDRSALDSFGILSNFVAPIQNAALLAEKLDYVKISISGATPDVYESMMKGAKWDRLMSNIAEVKKAGLDSIWFIFILQKSNCHQIEEIMELSDRLGVDHLLFKQLSPTQNQEWYEKENVAKEAARLSDEVNRLKSRYSFTTFSDLDHGGSGLLVFMDSVAMAIERKYVCKSPWMSFESHLDGRIHPCCFNLAATYGNINTDSVDQIWNGPAIQEFRGKLSELKYLESGCPPQCPDLALQLKFNGENIVLEELSRKNRERARLAAESIGTQKGLLHRIWSKLKGGLSGQ